MAVIKPYRALRPRPDLVEKVAAPPYDVISSEEARQMAEGNPISYLWINKAEINFPPGKDPHSDDVYLKARQNLERLVEQGVMIREERPRIYLYEQQMGDHVQAGFVAAASVDEYDADAIKKHEHTKPDKVADRARLIDTLNATGGPVFLAYRSDRELARIMDRVRDAGKPTYDFQASDKVFHRVWILDDADERSVMEGMARIPTLYVADGHHRSAASSRVRQMRKAANPGHRGDEPYNYFLAVLFPHDQLRIMDYNRLVKDLRGLKPQAFIDAICGKFEVTPTASPKPGEPHVFGMFLEGRWHRLVARKGTYPEKDPVLGLDVSILQENLLGPVLGIENPRTDPRIDFVGGIRGLGELEKRVNEGWAVAFALYPTTLTQLFSVADAGQVMPPKSTWFEPKLKSGLLVRTLDG